MLTLRSGTDPCTCTVWSGNQNWVMGSLRFVDYAGHSLITLCRCPGSSEHSLLAHALTISILKIELVPRKWHILPHREAELALIWILACLYYLYIWYCCLRMSDPCIFAHLTFAICTNMCFLICHVTCLERIKFFCLSGKGK